jgi:hypothetical protein
MKSDPFNNIYAQKLALLKTLVTYQLEQTKKKGKKINGKRNDSLY